MRLLRGILGTLLWVLGAVLGLVALLLCLTVILLPVGLPLLRLSRRLLGNAVRLMMPRPVAHPVRELGRSGKKARLRVKRWTPRIDLDTKNLKKYGRRLRKQLP